MIRHFLLFLSVSTLATARLHTNAVPGRFLQDADDSSWLDGVEDFFTDDRCLRTGKVTDGLLNLSNWMSKLDNVSTLRLLDLTLPGTHNSAGYDLSTDLNKNDPDFSQVQEGTLNIPEQYVAQWVCKFALTQSLSLSEQLQAGIRYLDIRIDYDPATSSWRGYHMLFGLQATDLLTQIADFAKEHPKEIILVEIGNLYADVTAEQKAELRNIITNLFAGMLVPTTIDLGTITIGALQDAGQNLLVVARDDDLVGDSDVLWDDKIIENTWAETDEVDVMVAYNEARLVDFANFTATKDKFYKIQWILTPDASYIQMNPLAGSLYALAGEANPKLGDFQRSNTNSNNSTFAQLGNMLSVDYVEISPLMKILGLEGFSDGAFVAEEVEPQSKWTGGAKAGLIAGVIIFLCGLACFCKWCRNKNKN